MRLDKTSHFYVVTDPTPFSELGDILFETTLEGLERQFAGGFSCAQNPSIFTVQSEAEYDAKLRLKARA